MDGEFDTSTEFGCSDTGHETAVSEIEDPALIGEFGTSTEVTDVETQVADETAVSEIEDPALVGEFDTSTESADVETQVADETAVSQVNETKIRLWLESSDVHRECGCRNRSRTDWRE